MGDYMLAPIFQTFIDRLREDADRDALRDALSGIVEAFGLSGFAYVSTLEVKRDIGPYLTTYPGRWVTRYLRERYHDIDPVVIQARRCATPFHWDCQSPSPAASEEERRLFGEAEEFGIECGLSFPIHDGRRHPALLSFAYPRRQGPLSATIEKHLHLAALYFHVHARPKLEASGTPRFPLLSRAEASCLQWIARGKRSADIAEILDLSQHAVLWHLRSAKRKLGANTLSQAVAAALHDRMIEP
jgi:LuxR family transcriptional regulator, activator of conjugal transfer of Ti plasmids